MGKNESRTLIAMLSALLCGMLWIGWQTRAIRSSQSDDPDFSGVTLEWTVKRPNQEPVKIIQQLREGQSEQEWRADTRRLIEGVEDFK